VNRKVPLTYDSRHKMASHAGGKTTWHGDPARGDFTPASVRKKPPKHR